jgi:integrase
MIKVNFNLREPKSQNETPIHMILRWDNQRIVESTGLTINPKFWDTDQQKIKTTKSFPIGPDFNFRLSDLRSSIEKLFVQFTTRNGHEPSKSEFQTEIHRSRNSKGNNLETSEQFVRTLIATLGKSPNPRNGKPYSKSTISAYNQCLEKILEFCKKAKRIFTIETIDLDFYYSFHEYLSSKTFKTNYIGKNIKTLKTFMNEALEKNHSTNRTHFNKRFKIPTEDSTSIYLSFEELREMHELDLSETPRLENVRDLFLISCFTGLRFSDLSQLKREHIIQDESGNQLIQMRIQKTKQLITIPVLPEVITILSKYSQSESYNFPKAISNQKSNQYLKEITKNLPSFQGRIEIEHQIEGKRISRKIPKWELITTHTGRRSFATNSFLKNIQVTTIMKITGHKTESSFYRYLKMSPKENAIGFAMSWTENNLTQSAV